MTNPGARPTPTTTEATSPQEVQSLFNAIAPTYDRLNHLLSFGLDRLWWRHTARAFAPILARPKARILDLCCGTGDQTAALQQLRPPQAEPITGLDFSSEMLARSHRKFPQANITWLQADAMHLPFPDCSLDLVTAAFGFRNLPNYAAALAEIYRVLAPGGQLGILEANQPTGLRALLYNAYFHHLLPFAGGLLSGQPAAYRYLPASVQRFPRPPQMLQLLREANFLTPHWHPHLLQAAGLYTATKSS